jgi:hypothetical protein
VFVRPAEDKALARRLRREGRSVRDIAAEIGAARSTISLWVRDVALDAEQQAALDASNPALNHRQSGQLVWSRMKREARAAAQEDGRRRARAGSLLHQAGCMLYWAEGSKHRNHVTFTNSDADMVAFFLRFLRECYGIQTPRVALSVNCHLGNGLTVDEIQTWWLERLGLPSTCLRAPAVNRASKASKGIRRPLVYGTARLVVHSTFVVQSIYGAIQEYAACSRPEWAELGL